MSIPTPPPAPVLETLRGRLQRGREHLAKGKVPAGTFQMWTGSVRAALSRIYGAGVHDIDALFPIVDVKAVSGQDLHGPMSESVEKLDALVGNLESAAKPVPAATTGSRVFIGHGRSPLWRELKDLLQDRLHLPWDEFNREPVAGLMTFERLNSMLDQAAFAFLIMTAEEEHDDKTLHARENVVHEVGLFQGRLGPRRAIVLLEEGCQEFSNIVGLSQIRFSKGDIAARSEEIRRVLEREGLIKPH